MMPDETVAAMLARVAPRPASTAVGPAGGGARFLNVKIRRQLRAYILRDNATIVIEHLPAPGEEVHWLLPGAFVFGDFIPVLCHKRGPIPHLVITTLGMSDANLKVLIALLDSRQVETLTICASNYWRATDRQRVPDHLDQAAAQNHRMKVHYSRIHTKVILAANTKGDAYVFAGSANLRSSGTLEQMSCWNDAGLLSFHQSWIDALLAGDPILTGGIK